MADDTVDLSENLFCTQLLKPTEKGAKCTNSLDANPAKMNCICVSHNGNIVRIAFAGQEGEIRGGQALAVPFHGGQALAVTVHRTRILPKNHEVAKHLVTVDPFCQYITYVEGTEDDLMSMVTVFYFNSSFDPFYAKHLANFTTEVPERENAKKRKRGPAKQSKKKSKKEDNPDLGTFTECRHVIKNQKVIKLDDDRYHQMFMPFCEHGLEYCLRDTEDGESNYSWFYRNICNNQSSNQEYKLLSTWYNHQYRGKFLKNLLVALFIALLREEDDEISYPYRYMGPSFTQKYIFKKYNGFGMCENFPILFNTFKTKLGGRNNDDNNDSTKKNDKKEGNTKKKAKDNSYKFTYPGMKHIFHADDCPPPQRVVSQ